MEKRQQEDYWLIYQRPTPSQLMKGFSQAAFLQLLKMKVGGSRTMESQEKQSTYTT